MKKTILILSMITFFNISFADEISSESNEKLVKEFVSSIKSDILYENFRNKFKNDEEFMKFINQNELYDYIEKRDSNAN